MIENIERNGILKNGFQILNPLNRHEFWFIVRESNFIVTPKTLEMCRVSCTKNCVKYTVFGVAYTLLELALTDLRQQLIFDPAANRTCGTVIRCLVVPSWPVGWLTGWI